MLPDPRLVTIIRQAITQEIYNAFGMPRHWWGRRFLDPLFWLPAQRFALRAARFEADAAGSGISTAARGILHGLVDEVCVFGVENIPGEGPVLLAGNHPGAYDSLAVLTGLRREDVKIVVSGVDFTRSLPFMSEHLIYVTPDPGIRMKAVRESLRHLRAGGTVLIFSSGLVDPDPGLWPEAAMNSLSDWSRSLALLLWHAAETQLVIVTTSHVLTPVVMRNPLTRLVRPDWRQRRLAEYLQVMQQLAFGRQFHLKPRVSFSRPVSFQEVEADAIPAVIHEKARTALEDHLSRAGEDCWYSLS